MTTRRFWYVSDRNRSSMFVPPLTLLSTASRRIRMGYKLFFPKESNTNNNINSNQYHHAWNVNNDGDDEELLNMMLNDDDIDSDIQNFDDMIHRLRNNELTILRLGWTESDYFSHHSTIDSSHRHHLLGSLVTLERALRLNRSVRSISLGWRLSPQTLFHILTAVTYHGLSLYQLRHIKIVVLESEFSSQKSVLPDTILTDLFHRQQKLISIDLQSVHVQVSKSHHHQQQQQQRCTTNEAFGIKSKIMNTQKLHPLQSHRGSVITNCILQQYQKLSRLKSLSLIDCGVTGDIAIELAQFIHIRGGISELSLRSNRKLSVTSKVGQNGIRMICQAPIMRRLDLSLCDLEGADIVQVADGIAARTYPIGEIALSGNYRMDNIGLSAMVQPLCCQKMLILNISYCSISSNRLANLLNALAHLKSCDSLLRRVVLCGASVTNEAATHALQHLLLSDCPIRSLDLHDPQQPKPLSIEQIRRIASAISTNYEMEELIFNHRGPEHVDIQLLNDLDFYCQLNQVGRRIIRAPLHPTQSTILSSQAMLSRYLDRSVRHLNTGNSSAANDWYNVLEKAGKLEKLDTLYWIIRHGGANLFHNAIN